MELEALEPIGKKEFESVIPNIINGACANLNAQSKAIVDMFDAHELDFARYHLTNPKWPSLHGKTPSLDTSALGTQQIDKPHQVFRTISNIVRILPPGCLPKPLVDNNFRDSLLVHLVLYIHLESNHLAQGLLHFHDPWFKVS